MYSATGKHVRSTPRSRAMRRTFWGALTLANVKTAGLYVALFAILAVSTLIEGITL